MLEARPDVQRALFDEGVPEGFIGRRYQAAEALAVIADEHRRSLIRFGSTGLGASVCVDPASGEVVEMMSVPAAAPLFINASLDQFARTIRALATRFPYYAEAADEGEIQAASDDLSRIIGEIDSSALLPDRYWSTFIDDVRFGDLSTEAVDRAISG